MKCARNRILAFSISLFLLFAPQIGTAQDNRVEETDDIDYVNAAREMMIATSTCALITLDSEGRPRVRVMDPFTPEDDLTVWLATNPNSRKVSQIMQDPRVTLYYLEEDASGYVMIHGTAQLVENHYEKEKHWKGSWETFYPNYPYDYLLIKVTPEWMEIVSNSRGIVGDSITWKPPEVIFKKKD